MFKFICLLALIAAAYAASIGNTTTSAPVEKSTESTTETTVAAPVSKDIVEQDKETLALVPRGRSLESTTEKREVIPVVRFESDKKPDGSFRFMYETGDQTFREESGTLTNAGTDDEVLEVSGSYRYIDAAGNVVEVHYTAGKNGFVPTGTNILPEITAVAKAAADLPDISQADDADEPEELVANTRQSRAKGELEDKSEKVKKIEKTKNDESAKNEKKSEKSENNNEKAEKAAATTEEPKAESSDTPKVAKEKPDAE